MSEIEIVHLIKRNLALPWACLASSQHGSWISKEERKTERGGGRERRREKVWGVGGLVVAWIPFSN